MKKIEMVNLSPFLENSFSKNLHELRIKNNLSYENLGKKLDIASYTLQAYEEKFNLPCLSNALKISIYFDIDLILLLGSDLTKILATKKGTYSEEQYYKKINPFVNMQRNRGMKTKEFYEYYKLQEYGYTFEKYSEIVQSQKNIKLSTKPNMRVVNNLIRKIFPNYYNT